MCWGKEYGESRFQEEYSHIFDSIAEFIISNPNVKFEIRCHTDARGSESSNKIFSQNAANDWKNWLIKSSVDSTQLTAVGLGENYPRTVWLLDSEYLLIDPKDERTQQLVLTEEYINQFIRTDKVKYELLHQLNRRKELVVVLMD